MESSPASAEVKGSTQAEERETEKKGWRGRGGRQSQTTMREDKHAEHIAQHGWLEVADLLPAHAVAAGSPLEPGGTEAWNVDCRSKRSLCIFTALQRRRDEFRRLNTTPPMNKQTYATNLFQPEAKSVPIGAAGCREEVYGWCCADGAPAGGDWRCVCGGEGGPLGELLEPLFLRN